MNDIAYVAGLLVIGCGLYALYYFLFREPADVRLDEETMRESIRKDNKQRILDRGFLKK